MMPENKALHKILVCLGSNFLDAESRIRSAARFVKTQVFSHSISETPVYGSPESDYLNQLLCGETSFDQDAILKLFKDFERAQGRKPEDKVLGKVCIDIDLLSMDDAVLRNDYSASYVKHGLELMS